MANARADLSTYLTQDAMKPENMTQLLVALAQGPFIIDSVMNLVPSTDDLYFEKEIANSKFKKADKIAEKASPGRNTIEVEKVSVSAYEYRESFEITNKVVKPGNFFAFLNIMLAGMDTIASRIGMTSEVDGITELSNTSTYTNMNTLSATDVWSSAAGSDPFRDIVLASELITRNSQLMADAVILGSQNYHEMTLSDSIRDTKQYTIDYTENGIRMGSLAGLDVLQCRAQYLSGSTYVPILNGSAIVLNTARASNLYEAQPYEADRDWDTLRKVITLVGSRRLAPKVVQEKAITIVSGI